MLSIFLQTIKDRKWSVIVYIITAILFVWMYVAMFPSFADKKEEFEKVMEAYPESMIETFGIKDAASIFENIENFLAVENYSFLWPIMLIALCVSIGGYTIAGEVERKTIETLLSQPIDRIKLYWAKYLSGLVIIAIFSIVTIMSVIPLAKLYNVSYQLTSHFFMLIIGLLFALSVYSLTVLFSTIFNERSKPYFMTIGILIIMYALNIVSGLKDDYDNLKYASFFYYFDPAKALSEQQIGIEAVLIFCGISVISALLGLIIFKNKNIIVS